jgi:hypothetical protein
MIVPVRVNVVAQNFLFIDFFLFRKEKFLASRETSIPKILFIVFNFCHGEVTFCFQGLEIFKGLGIGNLIKSF